MKQLELLLKSLDEKITQFRNASDDHKRIYRGCRVSVILLTSVSTLLSSAALYFAAAQVYLNMGIVLVTSTVTAISAYEALRRAHDLWVHERAILYELMDLKTEIEFHRAAEASQVDVEKSFQQFQSILRNSGERWVRMLERGGAQDQAATKQD